MHGWRDILQLSETFKFELPSKHVEAFTQRESILCISSVVTAMYCGEKLDINL